MNWTRTLPTERGWYWVKCPPGPQGWVSAAVVAYHPHPQTGQLVNRLGMPPSPDDQFWGPIPFPDGEAPEVPG